MSADNDYWVLHNMLSIKKRVQQLSNSLIEHSLDKIISVIQIFFLEIFERVKNRISMLEKSSRFILTIINSSRFSSLVYGNDLMKVSMKIDR